MRRRQFLRGTFGAAASLTFARAAFAQPHAMHGGMGGMSGMAGMQGMADSGASAAASASSTAMADMTLADVDAMPGGAPLAPLRLLANESSTPGQFRATLVAQPVSRQLLAGTAATPMWLYGDAAQGAIAGPLIELREGDAVEVRVVNRLPQPTTIHWHGLPVPPDQDGNPLALIEPGASRTYRFTLPMGSAGTYWYHPHPHMQSAEQVFRGLAGPIIVRAADDPLAAWPERHLFFSDLRLDAKGAIPPNGMMDWMNGREGQFVMLNGARRPRMSIHEDERWRVWNACSARYLRLAFSDNRTFALVGSDGGLLDAPRDGQRELLIAPGERAEWIVRAASDAGHRSATLVAQSYDRRKMSMSDAAAPADPSIALADIDFMSEASASGVPDTTHASRALPPRLRAIEAPPAPVRRQSVVFSEAMDMQKMHAPSSKNSRKRSNSVPSGMAFMINGATFDPSRVTLVSRRGEPEIWSIENRTDMDHPFHLHGTQFQVVERVRDGRTTAEPYLAWRDTVNVEPGEIVRIATVQSMKGDRMFHCHILEHEDLGMMGTLRVV